MIFHIVIQPSLIEVYGNPALMQNARKFLENEPHKQGLKKVLTNILYYLLFNIILRVQLQSVFLFFHRQSESQLLNN